MAASTLSETDTGVYVDGTGDIVIVFTDTDLKKKSIILQEDACNFGMQAHMSDGYCVGDYAPYTPVRLFLPDIKRPDTPAYNIEEIERNEEHDGAWIGDQGTLIIHLSDGNPPDRTLHIMFYYDTHNELRLIMCHFSPISVGVTKTEKFRPIMDDERLTIVPAAPNEANMPDHTPDTFHDRLDDIQKQIDEMKEHVSNALSIAQTEEATIDIIASRVSTLEEKTKTRSNARNTPDSNGFWRDIDDDVWAFDHTGNVRLIARGHKLHDDDYDIYNQSYNFSTEEFGPFTKIDNPFLKGEDHAD